MTEIYTTLSTIIYYLISYFNISFLLGNKKKQNIFILILGIIPFALANLVPPLLKVIFQFLILIIISTISYKNIKKVIDATFFQYWLLLIIEIFLTVILLLLKIELSQIQNLLFQFTILILTSLCLRQKTIMKFWNMIQKSSKISIIVSFIIALYMNIGIKKNIIAPPLISLFLLIYMYQLLKERLENSFLSQHIDSMINFTSIYEKEIENQRIKSHEFKNSLLYIRALDEKNKEVTDYIDQILGSNKPQNYELLKDVQKLKISPLKGFIYFKLTECEEKEIKYVLNISSNLPNKKIEKLDKSTIKPLNQIFGILLDNAIDACLETNNRCLSIYIFEEQEELVFQISNTFKGSIHINLLYKKGYSTKGKGRGYGLYIVQSILKENSNLSLKSEIHDDIFIQTLKLNLR